MSYTRLTQGEWQQVQRAAKTRFDKEILGTKPTFAEVKKTVQNPHTINFLEWLAVAVLIVLTIFTSFKMGTLAIPFAEGSLEILGQHTAISYWIGVGFKVATATLFILLATPSLIYAKLLDKSPEVLAEKKETADYVWNKRLSLEYITPRLPYLVVYISLAWLIYTSSLLPGSPFEQYLPVLVEITLATLVGNILQKRAASDKVVRDALKERLKAYEKLQQNWETNPYYLRFVYQYLREALFNLTRTDVATRKRVLVNDELRQADEKLVNQIVLAEYQRNNEGALFAKKVLTPDKSQPAEVRMETPSAPAATELRKPPYGEKAWTPETLLHDLKVRGLNPADGYTEAQLSKDYAPNYDARSAWRKGARDSFLGAK